MLATGEHPCRVDPSVRSVLDRDSIRSRSEREREGAGAFRSFGGHGVEPTEVPQRAP
jgi:hypothetical protein